MGGNSLPKWCVGTLHRDEVFAHEIGEMVKDDQLFPALIKKYGAKNVAEIGVAQANMSRRVVGRFKGQLEHYFCVDPWVPYPEWSDRPWKEWELSVSYWEGVYQKVKEWASRNQEVIILRMTSVDASNHIPEESLDGIYLDAVHDFPNFVCDVWFWLPKIKVGGFLSGHDYVRRFSGMIEAADMIFGQDLRLVHKLGGSWFVPIDSEAMRQKYLGVIRERVGECPDVLLRNPPDLFNQKDKVVNDAAGSM